MNRLIILKFHILIVILSGKNLTFNFIRKSKLIFYNSFKMNPLNIYSDFDFGILDNPDFEESSVREELISPLLKSLSYKAFGRNKILREKTITHPFVTTGSTKRRLTNYPDYLLEVNGRYAWVLDAKKPTQNIETGLNREQVYFYAIHPEINVQYYALCNGRAFILYQLQKTEPLLHFQLEEVAANWDKLKQFLAPDAFVEQTILKSNAKVSKPEVFDYENIKLPREITKVRKQATRRHFGPHGYFTRQSWDVLQLYIKTFSQADDLVLDPFGGGGTTLIEALMLGRKAIHIDLNPLSVFLVKALISPVNFDQLQNHYETLKAEYLKGIPESKNQIEAALKKYWYPKNIPLSKDADVEKIEELFTAKQRAQLAFLRHLILKIKPENIRDSLLLSFSSSVNKFNRTFHRSKSLGGGSSGAFIYYRHRIAPKPPDLNLIKIYETKYKKMIAAKREMAVAINSETIENAQIYQGDATCLDQIQDESIDYIYTDPPYGSKIAYLDLSVMWNAWLDFEVDEATFQKEAIEGGSRHKSGADYSLLLAKSIEECYRVLKFGRWMSFVFAHKAPKYWHLIVDTAEKIGFEYAGVVKQSNGQASFKKRQNPFSVLSGQLIINFKKVKSPQTIQKAKLGAEVYDLILETIEAVIAENDGASLEQINDRLIITGLELGFLDILSKEYKDLSPILNTNFVYNTESDTFHLIQDKKFKTNVPLDLRIRYFLLSYLRRKGHAKTYPTTDEIILDIMPLLRNGITPVDQTILNILTQLADQLEGDRWCLKKTGDQEMFN